MAVRLSPIWVGTQFFNAAGVVLGGGKINTYLAGTTTPQSTFTDFTGITPNANPIILDSAGRYSSQIWLTAGVSYKFVLTDSNNNVILTEDNLTGVNDTSAAGVSEWITGTTPTFVSATSFTVTGNQTATYQVGMRVKSTINSGNVYSTILTSVFGAVTTVTLSNDSSSLDATLSSVAYSILGETNPSIPANVPYNTSGVVKVKSAATARNSTTLANDPDLVYAIPSAGTYAIEVVLDAGNDGGTANLSFNVNFSGTMQAGNPNLAYWGTGNATTIGPSRMLIAALQTVSTAQQSVISVGGASIGGDPVTLMGKLVTTSSGTLGFSWGIVSGSGNTKICMGSYLKVTRIL